MFMRCTGLLAPFTVSRNARLLFTIGVRLNVATVGNECYKLLIARDTVTWAYRPRQRGLDLFDRTPSRGVQVSPE